MEQSPIPQLSILLKLFFRNYLVFFRNYSSETILQKLCRALQKLFRDLQTLFLHASESIIQIYSGLPHCIELG